MDEGLAKGLALWCGQGGWHTQPTQDQEAEITQFVAKCAQHNVKKLFPALVRRDYFPRFINFTEPAYQGSVVTVGDFYASWHPLKVLVEAAHACGIEVHPYLNLNHHGSRWADSGSALNTSTVFGAPVRSKRITMETSKFASDNPQFWRKDRQGRNAFQAAGHIRLSPAFEAVRAHEIAQLLEIVESFSPDGLQVEFSAEPRDEHGVNVYGYELPALQAFEEIHGQSPLDRENTDPEWIRFRCGYTTTFLQELRSRLQQLPHPVPLTVSVIAADVSDPVSCGKVLQDWPTWVREGLIDGLCLWYREFINPEAIPGQTAQVAEVIGGRCSLMVELSCYHRGALTTTSSIVEAGRLALAGGADAVGIYRADPVESLNLWPALEELAYQNS